jgi:hypothetical protein
VLLFLAINVKIVNCFPSAKVAQVKAQGFLVEQKSFFLSVFRGGKQTAGGLCQKIDSIGGFFRSDEKAA